MKSQSQLKTDGIYHQVGNGLFSRINIAYINPILTVSVLRATGM